MGPGSGTSLLEPGEVLTCEAYVACVTPANGLAADGFFNAETARDYVEEAAYTAIVLKRP